MRIAETGASRSYCNTCSTQELNQCLPGLPCSTFKFLSVAAMAGPTLYSSRAKKAALRNWLLAG